MVSVIDHTATGWKLIRQADDALAQGDPEQASQKIWAAAKHAIVSIADSRGWPHEDYRGQIGAARRLREESGGRPASTQDDIFVLFQVAHSVCWLYEEGWIDAESLAHDIADTRRLLELLDEVNP